MPCNHCRTVGLSKEATLNLDDLADPVSFDDIHDCQAILQQPHSQDSYQDESFMFRLRRPATVGCISLLMLLIVTFTDFALEVVNAQMHRLDVVHYDALSTEVIRPPFRYLSATKEERPKIGLGSAAIASVTNVLSPILPFAGGVDLRRDFSYASNGLFSSLSSMIERMQDAFAADADLKANSPILTVPRGGGRMPSKLLKAMSSTGKRVKTDHVVAIAAPEAFVPLDKVADLTLSDVATAFRYAIERTKANFDENGFFNGQLPRVKTLLAMVESAVSLSRGKDVKAALTGSAVAGPSHGDVDALHFCAAMRIFAEWRLLRQTPEGYKGFALGMSLGQKDIVQNVLKIELATHAWLDHQRELRAFQSAWEQENYGESCPVEETNCMSDTFELRTPTLNDLLQHEIDMGVHDKLPRLKEKSAAMGLLWVRRQLHYQTSLFANILHVPQRFPSTRAAVSAAYSEVYDRFHGWAVQKIFSYSFQAAPEAEVVYKFMNPHRLREVVATAKRANGLSNTHSLKCGVATKIDLNPFGKVGQHIGSEWDKLAFSVLHLFGAPPRAVEMEVRGGDCNVDEGRSTQDQEQYIVQEMTRDAHQHINSYLAVAQPLLEDLATLFDAHNMNDPTKV